MNRRGEIDKAIGQARMGPADASFLRALLRRADNGSGLVTARYAVTLARLAADAKLSERTIQRAQAHTIRHGWWRPARDPDAPGKLTGLIDTGRDCDCTIAVGCQWCGKPLASARSQARYCSGRCREAARRARNRAGAVSYTLASW